MMESTFQDQANDNASFKEEKRMQIQKILYPTDLSENAAAALPHLTSLSEQYQAEIHVLHVLKSYGEWGAAYGEYDPADYEKMRQWERQTAEKRLDEICSKHLDQCILYVKHIAVGDAAEEILRLIDAQGIDMVVLTAKGGAGRFDFGSVAERVLRCSPVPVVTVPVP